MQKTKRKSGYYRVPLDVLVVRCLAFSFFNASVAKEDLKDLESVFFKKYYVPVANSLLNSVVSPNLFFAMTTVIWVPGFDAL